MDAAGTQWNPSLAARSHEEIMKAALASGENVQSLSSRPGRHVSCDLGAAAAHSSSKGIIGERSECRYPSGKEGASCGNGQLFENRGGQASRQILTGVEALAAQNSGLNQGGSNDEL
jgi:hypothetical protein